MRQIYETPQLLWITLESDIITTSIEGDDNVGGLPDADWTPGS